MSHFYSGMGCFWGAERRFWRIPGVFSTQVGYAGGFTPNPTYHEVCSGESNCSFTSHIKDVSDDTFPNLFPSQKHYASSSFTVPKLMLCCSLHQNIPFICSELPRVHCSLPDPQPFPLPLYDLLVARQFRRDEMEGGMQL